MISGDAGYQAVVSSNGKAFLDTYGVERYGRSYRQPAAAALGDFLEHVHSLGLLHHGYDLSDPGALFYDPGLRTRYIGDGIPEISRMVYTEPRDYSELV